MQGRVADNFNGSYVVSYLPTSVSSGAELKLTVTINGAPIPGSPFSPVLIPGPFSACECTASGADLYDGVTGAPAADMPPTDGTFHKGAECSTRGRNVPQGDRTFR